MSAPAANPADGPVVFDAVLFPHRSLGRTGFIVLMAVFATIALGVGGFFWAIGAWPIFGLYGLDVLLLYVALRLSYRSGRVYEKVRLTPAALTVERGDHRGPKATWTFQPAWLRIAVAEPQEEGGQLTLSSHGRSLVIGAFLSPQERIDFAQALRSAIERARQPWLNAEASA